MTNPLDGRPAGLTVTEEDEDTIELELSAEQMLALSQAAAVSESAPVSVESEVEVLPKLQPVARPKAPTVNPQTIIRRLGARPAVILSIAAASVMISSVAYLATIGARPAHIATNAVSVPTAPHIAAPLPAETLPVRFANPFDAGEVFEFPPGTSEMDARDAVAELLLQRARERQNAWQTVAGERRPDKDRSVAATKLAQRG
jgi:hypothetical protein